MPIPDPDLSHSAATNGCVHPSPQSVRHPTVSHIVNFERAAQCNPHRIHFSLLLHAAMSEIVFIDALRGVREGTKKVLRWDYHETKEMGSVIVMHSDTICIKCMRANER